MIEFLKQNIAAEASSERKINRLREILQLTALKILQDKGYFSNLAFVGGTALRLLYNMKRFSEDLDFSVIDKNDYKFQEVIAVLKAEFELRGVKLEADVKAAKTVQSAMLKFPGLLKILAISALRDHKVSIRIEADSNPPSGWRIENTLVNNIYMLNITHFDLPSLYATKIHACFFRKYIKGRDFYDFVWYLGKRVKPNYELLNNAIIQTHGRKQERLSDRNIKDFLLSNIAKIDFGAIKRDVERFLEDKGEVNLLEKSIISKGIEDVFKRVNSE